MHDVVAHKVSLISLQAGALQVGRPGDADVRTTARSIHELSAQTLTELRHLVGVLRTAGGTDTQAVPRAGLAGITDLVRDSGLPVDLDVPTSPAAVPEAVERAAYRTVQEALTNICKHAPGARARIRVHFAAGLHIEVHNSPPPGSPPTRLSPGAATAWWACENARTSCPANSTPARPRTAASPYGRCFPWGGRRPTARRGPGR
ncbi:sensor histidine kinase [Streptomyces violaceus]|uniref:histidine kinase n=1 Tax=Streptomyces violaceus TaxID=1936 RepID=A0ABY9ULQ0_STRVL|nr:histidine kinase [Streptomyces janthinus]WND23780.1 histidine kinase [Streptomyces janthinus]